jgi:hypothetical protein
LYYPERALEKEYGGKDYGTAVARPSTVGSEYNDSVLIIPRSSRSFSNEEME